MRSEPLLILGIDGGGTKTVAWLASPRPNSQILGRGTSGPSNQRAVGPVLAMKNLDAAVESAFENAGLNRQTVHAACLGLAGVDRPSDRGAVLQWADDARLALRVRVVNDAVPLLFAGPGNGTGIALIAGTGSLAWGRNSMGQTARAGGWGYLLGDEGSAFALGTAALKAVIMAADGRAEETALLQPVLESLKISSTAEIVPAVYSSEIPRAVLAGLAPLLFQPELQEDAAVRHIVHQAAQDLATMTDSVARQLHMPAPYPLAVTGSVLLQQETYRTAILQALTQSGCATPSVTLVPDAAEGAIRLAEDLLLAP